MKKTANIGADFTLDQTKDACEKVQQGGFQLENITTTTIKEGNKTTAKNKAVFERVHSDEILNELTFIEAGTSSKETIKKMEEEERTAICEGDIFVQNKVTRVLVFGKTV